jgi:hypothetical protein
VRLILIHFTMAFCFVRGIFDFSEVQNQGSAGIWVFQFPDPRILRDSILRGRVPPKFPRVFLGKCHFSKSEPAPFQ